MRNWAWPLIYKCLGLPYGVQKTKLWRHSHLRKNLESMKNCYKSCNSLPPLCRIASNRNVTLFFIWRSTVPVLFLGASVGVYGKFWCSYNAVVNNDAQVEYVHNMFFDITQFPRATGNIYASTALLSLPRAPIVYSSIQWRCYKHILMLRWHWQKVHAQLL